MPTQGQWSGQWHGQWFGPTEDAPPGSISGSASLSLSVTGTLTSASTEVEGQDNGVQRPAAGLHVVAPPKRQIENDPVPGWIEGRVVLRLDAFGAIEGIRRIKRPRRQWLEVLELELV